jgi:hypothetical protein
MSSSKWPLSIEENNTDWPKEQRSIQTIMWQRQEEKHFCIICNSELRDLPPSIARKRGITEKGCKWCQDGCYTIYKLEK